jgi:hypothetical protein
MAMHHLFHIAELLHLICLQLQVYDRRALHSLVRTNRAFSLAALPHLWAHPPSVVPLMKLICHDSEIWDAMEDSDADIVSAIQ